VDFLSKIGVVILLLARNFNFMVHFKESTLEEAVLDYLAFLGWQVTFGLGITPSELATLQDALLLRLMSGDVRVGDLLG